MKPFKVYVIADITTEKERIDEAMEQVKKRYEKHGEWSLDWSIEHQDLSDIPWQVWTNTKWPKWSWIKNKLAEVASKHPGQYHTVMFYVPRDKWKAEGAGGLNTGRVYKGMSSQVCLYYSSDKYLWQVIAHELAHCFDEQIYYELGTKLEKYLGLEGDVDDIVVHAEGNYVEYEYYNFYSQISELFNKMLKEKQKKEIMGQEIEVYKKLIKKYRELILKVKNKSTT